MTKTIAEQFEEEYRNPGVGSYNVMKNAIERIEERIAAIEQSALGSEHSYNWEHRSAPAIEHPVQQAGEWIDKYWLAWRDTEGNWNVDLSGGTFAMPYHEGMKKPEPPEVK